MKLGFLYAGQGSQHPGMGADLYEAYPAFRQVMDAAQAEVDFDLKRTCFEDPEGVLNQTRYTQPCMVAFAAGLTAVLREKGIVPSAAAGLSLGEYSALHAAGVFDARTAVRLVAFRGKAMEEAAKGHDSAMMAVLGLEREPLQAACEAAADLEALNAALDSIRAAADAFKAETVDYTRESIVLRVTADSVRIDSFLDLMRDYDILEICRTGVVSLERGAETIRSGMQV